MATSISPQQFLQQLKASELPISDLVECCQFDSDNYCRNRVWQTAQFEILLVGWLPGQRTEIHNHNGSTGAVTVLQGEGLERCYRHCGNVTVEQRDKNSSYAGTILSVEADSIHRLECSPSSKKKMVTLHIYTPPLTTMNVFHEKPQQNVSSRSSLF